MTPIADEVANGQGVKLAAICAEMGIHASTGWRWYAKGLPTPTGRVRLEVVRVGKTVWTSRRAFATFLAATTVLSPEPAPRPERRTRRTPSQRANSSAAAMERLRQLGAG